MSVTPHNEPMTATKRIPQITLPNGDMVFIMQDNVFCAEVTSTSIQYWAYMPNSKRFTVQYRTSETYYTYVGVPFEVVHGLMTADSVGKYVATEIKPNYECRS